MSEKESLKDYRKRVNTALENDFLRTAMDNFAAAYRTSRENAFAGMDVEGIIQEVAAIKSSAVKKSEQLFELFKSMAESHGVHVHLAENGDDANRIITDIAKETGTQKIVKSKSMTAEEIHLNQWMETEGLEVTETDLGEWIVQLRHEGPSHMVMPAIHLSRYQVADLFSDVTGSTQDSEIEKLVKVARRQLRKKYAEADMGITGANYAVADTGTIGIVTNEGNARLVTTLPRVHVALIGIDKLLPSITDALSINRILPRNATGQGITSYVTWITGPSECAIAEGRKREMHIVFLDNGRKKIAADPVFAQVLQCVRCGACANVCPVYRMVGGHQMGHIYIGAIGLITTYFFHGSAYAKNLVQNCTNCGACRAVCAGGIDLPRLIKEIHAKIQDEDGHPLKSLLLGKVLKSRKLFHTLLKTARSAQKPLTGKTPYLRHLPMVFSKEHNFRRLPKIAKVPFRDMFGELNRPLKTPQYKIALFSGCLQDFVYPEQLESAMKAFKKVRASVEFPMEQTCCGLPALMMGEKDAAKSTALQNIKAFKESGADYIVTLCASCASHLKNSVPLLAENYAKIDALNFAEKVVSFSQFLSEIAGMDAFKTSIEGRKTAFHSPCHLCRGLGIKQAPHQVIEKSGNIYVKTAEEETCCGFGGSFSANFPSVSREILKKKLSDVEQSGAELLVTECPGCVMQLRGGAVKEGREITVKHLSEIL